MKTIFKAAAAAILAVAAAFALRAMYMTASVDSSGDNVMDVYQDMMLQARAMFVEKADDIQSATAALLDDTGLEIMSDKDGRPWVMQNGEAVSLDDAVPAAQPYLDEVFAEYECGGKIYNIKVCENAVLFFTGYHESGSVGFLYEKTLGSVTEFTELLELSENWKLFYDMSEE